MAAGNRTPASAVRTHDTDADEPIDPPLSSTTNSSRDQSRSTTPTPHPVRESSTTTTTTTTASTHPATKLHPKRTLSATTSPIPSREPSPVRPSMKQGPSTRSTRSDRSRKNSSQDVSPSRSTASANPPSAAATQRALSTTSIPTLYPNLSESTIRAPVPQKPLHPPESRDTPRWPTSPRLKSPPPINKPAIPSPRKTDQQDPFNALRPSQPMEQVEGKQRISDSEAEDLLLPPPGMRTPARGASSTTTSTLETVQEVSQASSPAQGLEDKMIEQLGNGIRKVFSGQDVFDTSSEKTPKATSTQPANESGSESGGKGEIKMKTTSSATVTASRPSAPAVKSFGTGRGKPSGEGSTRNMTVETETVSSIPQVAVGGPAANGSIRTKPSSETIRPKKEKKKSTRKAPSVTSGTGEHSISSRFRFPHHSGRDISDSAATCRSPERASGQGPYSPHKSSFAVSPEYTMLPASRRTSLSSIQRVSSMLTRIHPASSKADIFEAKVASAVDEANSSDSEETFVYESNPPDTSDRPRRYHSRTPSTASMASQIDQRNGPRSAIDGGHSVAMKKSMKFANSFTSNGPDSTTGDDDGKGTARSNIGTGRGTTHHHHHIGRWGRNGGNGHASLFDNESPFPNATKSKFSGSGPRQTSGPTSPRLQNSRIMGNGKKFSPISSGYDLDDAADDERTPLMSTVRSGRSGRGRRGVAASIRQLEHQASRHDRSFLARFAGCLLLSIMIMLAISGAGAFMFATTQPLQGVKIVAIKNVLASEQDVIFNIKVQARNPNIVAVGIDTADIVIFAKSKYAGTDSEWWSHPPPGEMRRRRMRRNGDSGLSERAMGSHDDTDPNLQIGHVYELDSALSFEGSPFQHARTESVGQIHVDHPGNNTIPAGSQRWGRVLQHEFDLIVRGTLKYTLPLSSRVRSIPVEGRVTVKPNAADQDPDTVHINAGELDELIDDTTRG
ncbi:Uncharacterized protein BP5553_04916 [Venustampulla echinocandica]|uniref:Uncharacterized protein n=1 Tax=Venustampulla echinocandica TaxID=2656787 RepID=A0A370TPN2_9HELO|nr:Uncharacterized protein BP5553_04916 [Venustampulla echinocandica]RDL37483.1 Uncharacterized protein BP5553_04916 [Venustampulla echinocandica]